MTRLVLHVGAEHADQGAVQRDLVTHRDALREAGIMVPNRDTAASWREVATGLLRGTSSATSLISRARESDAEIVLVSSDLLSDALVSPDEAAQLAHRAAAEGLDVRIVIVVREQVGYINSLYCKRIMNLETARGLDEFAALATPAHRFDYVASFGAIADTPGLELVAIPYPELLAKGAGRAVVEAAAPTASIPAALGPSDSGFEPLPGPVLLAATRLLHKRLRRLNAFHEQGKAPLRPYTQKLKERAEKTGWDTAAYWGWSPAEREAIAEEYRESNDAFAEFVWGTSWPEPPSDGRLNRVDLPDLAPALLRGLLTTVDKLVQEAIEQPWLET
jgi:hypothetical protein